MSNALPALAGDGEGVQTAGEHVPAIVPPTSDNAAPNGVDPRYLADTDDAARWRADLAERIWQQQRRKDAEKALRREMAVRRTHGLAARHAAKQRR